MNRPKLNLGVKFDEDPQYDTIVDKTPQIYKPDFQADRAKTNLQKGLDHMFAMGPAQAQRTFKTTDPKTGDQIRVLQRIQIIHDMPGGTGQSGTIVGVIGTSGISGASKTSGVPPSTASTGLPIVSRTSGAPGGTSGLPNLSVASKTSGAPGTSGTSGAPGLAQKQISGKKSSEKENLKVDGVLIKETTSVIQVFGAQVFNRPIYIRKLKKIAENFEFQTLNEQNHIYYDVVRPFECQKSRLQTIQRSNSQAGYFEDSQFPATAISVGRTHKKQQITWKKVQQFCVRPVFGKYVQPNDFQVGRLSCPSFLSVLSCLAQRQKNIKRIIEKQQLSSNGFYYVRLNINGVWRYIPVDDFLPQIQEDNVGVLSFKDSQSQISISIIEKAYAKAYNGYSVFERQSKPEHYLKDLTGSRVARYQLSDKNLQQTIKSSLEQSWTVIAVPNSKVEQLGLNSKFNLGIIGVGNRGLQLRNSWGTIIEKTKISFSKEGLFQLSIQQANKYFDYILIAQTDDTYLTSTIQSKHHSGFYSTYNFKIKNTEQSILSINQWDTRLYPVQSNRTYSPFRLILEKKKSPTSSEFVGGAFTSSKRNTDLLCSLSPGQYTVHCIGSWNQGQALDFTITLYGSQLVKYQRSQTQPFPNLITRSLQQLNLDQGKRSSKGHVDQYILYHQPTNLVLLTNLNVSGKSYDYTQDLSKIIFTSLNLVNVPNAQENYGTKLQDEITEAKDNYNTDRRWNIHLQAKEAYTWVISTNEEYNLNNFKNWGFK